METRSDAGILKDIYEAERLAERIVREAETEAKALLDDAGAAAEADAAKRREDLRRRAGETLRARIDGIDREIDAFLAEREAETDRWVRRRRAEIGRIVDRLVAMVLPP